MVWSRRNFILLSSSLTLARHGVSEVLAAPPSTVELVMVEETGCRFCRKWDADVGPAYLSSPEGRFAPLKRVKRGAPEIAGFAPATYTPTFILVRDQTELGRITGYPGASFFWEELAPLLQAAGFAPQHQPEKM